MKKKSNPSRQVTHIAVIDQSGNLIQTIEVPPNMKPGDFEFLGFDPESKIYSHIPPQTLISPDGAINTIPQLPIPDGKAEKELFLGQMILRLVTQTHQLEPPISIVNNPKDPPDLLVTSARKSIGIELCELIYPARYLNDSLIERYENAIRSRIPKELFSNYQITFMLKSRPNGIIRLPKGRQLEIAIYDLIEILSERKFLAPKEGFSVLLPEEYLPDSCKSFLHMVLLNNIGAVNSAGEKFPGIQFANAQQEFSEEILRTMVQKSIGRKLDKRTHGDNILLIWSQHRSLLYYFPKTCEIIRDLLLERMKSPFYDVLYLHRSTENLLGIIMQKREIRVRVKDD